MNGDHTIHINMYNLKGTGVFDGKFPFDSIVKLKDMLPNIVVLVNTALVVFQKRIIYYCFSIVGDCLPVCIERNIE